MVPFSIIFVGEFCVTIYSEYQLVIICRFLSLVITLEISVLELAKIFS